MLLGPFTIISKHEHSLMLWTSILFFISCTINSFFFHRWIIYLEIIQLKCPTWWDMGPVTRKGFIIGGAQYPLSGSIQPALVARLDHVTFSVLTPTRMYWLGQSSVGLIPPTRSQTPDPFFKNRSPQRI